MVIMKIKKIAIFLAAVMLCGCSNSSREAELQSEIDDLRSQLEDRDEKNSSKSGSDVEDPDKQGLPLGDGDPSIVDNVYDGIDWDNIPEAPASDFGYRIFYGELADDPEYLAGYSGDGSEFIKSIHIFDYFGHDKYVKIPKEIDGLPVTIMYGIYGLGFKKEPWDPECERVEVQCDDSVFRGTNVENIFIPEHLRGISVTAFDDCPTLKSISVDPNNLTFFSKDGVLFNDENVIRGCKFSYNVDVYTKLPNYTYGRSGSGDIESFNIQDEGEWIKKTPDCEFYGCYIDIGSKFALNSRGIVIKFTDGTYGACDRITGKYIPIDVNQFKRSTCQRLFRYPEGKRDKSYTVKKCTWTRFDENGSEQVKDDFASFYEYGQPFNNVQFLEIMEFEDGVVFFDSKMSNRSDSDIPIGVKKVVIPASLVSVGSIEGNEGYYNSFFGLTNLEEYEVDKNNPVFKSVDGALLSKDGKILYSMPCKIGKDYTVPDGVETIVPGAFTNVQDMTVTIPASVKYLGYSLDSPEGFEYSVFTNSSDITLNVSSKTEIRDIFEDLPESCEHFRTCTGLTVKFVD